MRLTSQLTILLQYWNESQSGIPYNEVDSFYNYCSKEKYNILGLMAIPTNDDNTAKYFQSYLN